MEYTYLSVYLSGIQILNQTPDIFQPDFYIRLLFFLWGQCFLFQLVYLYSNNILC